MIRAERRSSGFVLSADEIPADAFAYVDADWVPRMHEGVASALVVFSDNTARWNLEAPIAVPRLGPDEIADAALTTVAYDAYDAVAAVAPQRVEVTGEGFVAGRVRAILGTEHRTAESPAAVIETTGDPEMIRSAIRRVESLGTVVLAAEPQGPVNLNLYPDVHVRGLELVGVAPPLAGIRTPWERDDVAEIRQAIGTENPERVSSGEVAPIGAAWYRLGGMGSADA